VLSLRLVFDVRCPEESQLLDFALGTLTGDARAEIEAHVDACDPCFEVLADLGALDEPGPDAVGRYRIERVVGRGAMGTVYAAYDPVLDREVAVKVLRGDVPATEERRLRMLREARTLARIRHPNVVSVHDAGESGDVVYLAMELVEGESLDRWLTRGEHGWTRIVDRFIDAARGLVAAHEAGVVHRDFKPANVIVSTSGRVAVTDLGLAFAYHEPTSSAPTATGTSSRLTRGRLGTPAYMAPEQFEGEGVSAQTDQFAFCVALVEALTGERPFELRVDVDWQGVLQRGPSDRVLRRIPGPGTLRRVLLRGLAYAPGDRHPSMQAVVDALRACRAAPRRRLATALFGTVGVVAAAGGWLQTRPPPQCSGPLDGVWTEAHRKALSDALVGPTTGPRVTGSIEHALKRIDGHVQELAAGFDEVCAALPRRLDTAPSTARAQWSCLQGKRARLDATVSTLVDGGATHLGPVVDALRAPRSCLDPALAMRNAPEPDDAELAGIVADLRIEAEIVQVRSRASDPEALPAYDRLLDQASTLSYPPLEAELLAHRGVATMHTGDFKAAIADFEEAYATAMRSGHEAVAARATRMLPVVLRLLGSFDEGRTWAAAAEPLQREGWEKVELALVRGMMEATAYELVDAEAHYDHAFALRERCDRCLDSSPGLDAMLASEYGDLLLLLGRPERAVASMERAVALHRDRLGPGHIAVSDVLAALAGTSRELGDRRRALSAVLEAIAIADELGLPHPLADSTLGGLRADAGDHRAALSAYRRARATGAPGMFGAAVAIEESVSLFNLGYDHEASRLCRRALGVLTNMLGSDHMRTVWSQGRCEGIEEGRGDVG